MNCAANETLFLFIQKRVKLSTFCRLHNDLDEVVSDVYMMLSEQNLPDFKTEEFRIVLRKAVKRNLWDRKRPVRPMFDVDELDEDEHPFYEIDFDSEEKAFESFFEKFCQSVPEPHRTVYSRCRVLSRNNIVALTGLSQRGVTKIIKEMPERFKTFFEENEKTILR